MEQKDKQQPLRISSTDGVLLETHLAKAKSSDRRQTQAVLFLHGFPSADVWADKVGDDMGELADRAARSMGWDALSIKFRGCGDSTGNFSLQGWVDDAGSAIKHLQDELKPDGLWVCGFGTGGSVGLVAAALNGNVTGAAVLGSPADFDDWAEKPEDLLEHSRRVGAIKDETFPASTKKWSKELSVIRAVEGAQAFAPQPFLILHGSEDEIVPHFDARALADSHGAGDLRFVHGAGHQLRHDPRAIAVLLGWLDRHSTDELDD